MTDIAAARAALDDAQTLLEQSQADLTKLTEIQSWLPEAAERMRALEDFYRGPGSTHLDTTLAADPQAQTPPVVNEDAVWEVAVGWDDGVQRLLRFATAEITAHLDRPGGYC
ncbi:enamine deaminase RidA (YjgF/YER057c/UK114 family) [Kineosphaera limosa]|uniref:Uncharacterized protein n=1 Tax=Kineosphaera limosa NBRC 100340 TaxID=1184609 RepID=K6VDI5_9MICO|nr:hypothetical protein [Kineosphaera limosa]NYE02828.1 enamine deaminase RidA (YjgF/YER057c/UK114 family) [Kineosphaera limosa]GAB94258.1 hypothetical protein KILIM_004_00470 [Kineosphaera limosa NBRC 100340]